MKTFAAQPPAAQAIAFALAVGSVPAAVVSPRSSSRRCLRYALVTAIAVDELASLLIPNRYTLGMLVGFTEWWFEAGEFAVLA